MIKTIHFDDGEDLGDFIDSHGLASTGTIVATPNGFTLSFEAPEPDSSLPPVPWTYEVEKCGNEFEPNYRFFLREANGAGFVSYNAGPSELRAKRFGALFAAAPKMLDALKAVRELGQRLSTQCRDMVDNAIREAGDT